MTIREPRFFAYRASLLLAVGRVDEASKDIERALSLNPNYSDALALQSIIAVVQNEKEKALDIAKKSSCGRSEIRRGADRSFLCPAGKF